METKGAISELARMRTINEALQLIREQDPKTAITYNLIRQLLKENKIRYFRSGSRYILNFDDLLNVLK